MTHADPSPEAVSGNQPPSDNLMGLKLLVVFLGVILVVCMITFFILLFMKLGKSDEAEVPVIPEMAVHVMDDEVIKSMTLDGRDLAMQIEGPEGRRIVIVNPYTSDQKAVIHLKELVETTPHAQD